MPMGFSSWTPASVVGRLIRPRNQKYLKRPENSKVYSGAQREHSSRPKAKSVPIVKNQALAMTARSAGGKKRKRSRVFARLFGIYLKLPCQQDGVNLGRSRRIVS
jgi:hypothetical protein